MLELIEIRFKGGGFRDPERGAASEHQGGGSLKQMTAIQHRVTFSKKRRAERQSLNLTRLIHDGRGIFGIPCGFSLRIRGAAERKPENKAGFRFLAVRHIRINYYQKHQSLLLFGLNHKLDGFCHAGSVKAEKSARKREAAGRLRRD
ncbi:hypothetical protein KGMB02707_03670 [Mesosutterella multiformis]|nr:hypothetical protein KGMB02707_03670 [Mesosutterella multiformis]